MFLSTPNLDSAAPSSAFTAPCRTNKFYGWRATPSLTRSFRSDDWLIPTRILLARSSSLRSWCCCHRVSAAWCYRIGNLVTLIRLVFMFCGFFSYLCLPSPLSSCIWSLVLVILLLIQFFAFMYFSLVIISSSFSPSACLLDGLCLSISRVFLSFVVSVWAFTSLPISATIYWSVSNVSIYINVCLSLFCLTVSLSVSRYELFLSRLTCSLAPPIF